MCSTLFRDTDHAKRLAKVWDQPPTLKPATDTAERQDDDSSDKSDDEDLQQPRYRRPNATSTPMAANSSANDDSLSLQWLEPSGSDHLLASNLTPKGAPSITIDSNTSFRWLESSDNPGTTAAPMPSTPPDPRPSEAASDSAKSSASDLTSPQKHALIRGLFSSLFDASHLWEYETDSPALSTTLASVNDLTGVTDEMIMGIKTEILFMYLLMRKLTAQMRQRDDMIVQRMGDALGGFSRSVVAKLNSLTVEQIDQEQATILRKTIREEILLDALPNQPGFLAEHGQYARDIEQMKAALAFFTARLDDPVSTFRKRSKKLTSLDDLVSIMVQETTAACEWVTHLYTVLQFTGMDWDRSIDIGSGKQMQVSDYMLYMAQDAREMVDGIIDYCNEFNFNVAVSTTEKVTELANICHRTTEWLSAIEKTVHGANRLLVSPPEQSGLVNNNDSLGESRVSFRTMRDGMEDGQHSSFGYDDGDMRDTRTTTLQSREPPFRNNATALVLRRISEEFQQPGFRRALYAANNDIAVVVGSQQNKDSPSSSLSSDIVQVNIDPRVTTRAPPELNLTPGDMAMFSTSVRQQAFDEFYAQTLPANDQLHFAEIGTFRSSHLVDIEKQMAADLRDVTPAERSAILQTRLADLNAATRAWVAMKNVEKQQVDCYMNVLRMYQSSTELHPRVLKCVVTDSLCNYFPSIARQQLNNRVGEGWLAPLQEALAWHRRSLLHWLSLETVTPRDAFSFGQPCATNGARARFYAGLVHKMTAVIQSAVATYYEAVLKNNKVAFDDSACQKIMRQRLVRLSAGDWDDTGFIQRTDDEGKHYASPSLRWLMASLNRGMGATKNFGSLAGYFFNTASDKATSVEQDRAKAVDELVQATSCLCTFTWLYGDSILMCGYGSISSRSSQQQGDMWNIVDELGQYPPGSALSAQMLLPFLESAHVQVKLNVPPATISTSEMDQLKKTARVFAGVARAAETSAKTASPVAHRKIESERARKGVSSGAAMAEAKRDFIEYDQHKAITFDACVLLCPAVVFSATATLVCDDAAPLVVVLRQENEMLRAPTFSSASDASLNQL